MDYKNQINFKTDEALKKREEEILKKYEPLIKASIKKYCPVMKEYEDLFQDGCLFILNSLKNFDPHRGTTFGAYIKSGLRIYYLDTFRYLRKHSDSLPYSDEILTPTLEEEVFPFSKDLSDALGLLPSKERQVIQMIYYRGMKLASVASELNVSTPVPSIELKRRLLSLYVIIWFLEARTLPPPYNFFCLNF